MKITISRTNRQNRLCVSAISMNQLLERIAADDARQSVRKFRNSEAAISGDTGGYSGAEHWWHAYPAAEFCADSNGNMAFRRMNGVVQITFGRLLSAAAIAEAKSAAAQLPMTLAAIEGADGRSVVVLVRFSGSDGSLPGDEPLAERLYKLAYEQARLMYQPLLKAQTRGEEVSLRANFMMTLDAEPYCNAEAVPMRVMPRPATSQNMHLVEKLDEYEDNEFLYRKAAAETSAEMEKAQVEWGDDAERTYAYISSVSCRLCAMGMSEEEAFVHVRRNNWSAATEQVLRQLVGAAYDGAAENMRRVGVKRDARRGRASILKMMRLLTGRYVFRYNEVMKYTEYRPNNSWVGDFRPVGDAALKGLTIEVELEDINVSIKDVRNFLESTRIPRYNPIEDFLYGCLGKWDGKDHIRALARTVPTDNPHWADWFYTWFLAMVQQWRGTYRPTYGNSSVPLLISSQGYNKSTFCRRLIPDSLSWGYNDTLQLTEKRQVLQSMSQLLLINLDEFNQISAKVQQGFLKNILQLPTVKVRPPYGSHVVEFPRRASFIATSNMADVLVDPTGSRRFLGVELTGPVDVSVRPNYVQLYAQAMEALQNGEKSYFDAGENAVIMQSNIQFQVQSPFLQCFLALYEPSDDPSKGAYMPAATIFKELRDRFGASLKVGTLQRFGRELKCLGGLRSRRVHGGTEYLVVKKEKA